MFNEEEKNEMTRHWDAYWDNYRSKYFTYKLNFFQYEAYETLKNRVKEILQQRGTCKILNAGCGLDRIATRLKTQFQSRVDVSLMDISQKCLDLNKKNNEEKGVSCHYFVDDLFNIKNQDKKYDLVYNTGVMEHFSHNDQSVIIGNISKILNPGGLYYSFNPSNKGVIYKKMMKYAQDTGTWEYGEENPICTLEHLNGVGGMHLIGEYDQASLSQLYSLKYKYPISKYLAFCLSFLTHAPFLYRAFSKNFAKRYGYYILLSVFKKQ